MIYHFGTTERWQSEIILESLCYALEQAYSSRIGIIVYNNPSDIMQYAQLKDLVTTIDLCVSEWGIDDVMLEDIAWYSESQMIKIRNAKTLSDIYGK